VLRDAGYNGIFATQDAQTGERVVGVQPSDLVAVLQRIGAGSTITPDQVWRDVLRNGSTYHLTGGIRVAPGRVSREPVIQFHVPSQAVGDVLVGLGVKRERGVAGTVYYLPNDRETVPKLTRIMEQYPPARGAAAFSLRQTPIDPNATPAEIARDAEGEFRRSAEGAHVAVNWQGAKAIAAAMELLGYTRREWDGLTIPASVGREMLRVLVEIEKQMGVPMDALGRALVEAVTHGEPLVFVLDHPGIDQAAVRREEVFHRAQIIAGADDMIHLGPQSRRRFMLDPAAARVGRHLASLGYPREELAAEIPAKLQRGPAFWAEAGISEQDVQRVLDLYNDLITADHGKGAANAIQQGRAYSLRGKHGPGSAGAAQANPRVEQPGGPSGGKVGAQAQEDAGQQGNAGARTGNEALDPATPEGFAAIARTGAGKLSAGITGFRNWSQAMLAEFGRRIQPHLLQLYREAKKLWKDTSGELRLSEMRLPRRRSLAALPGDESGAVNLDAAGEVVKRGANLLRPLGTRIADQGRAGERLRGIMTRASDEGEVAAGGRVAALEDLQLGKLSRPDRFHLQDVLEGRAKPRSQAVADAARGIQRVFGGLAIEAQRSHVLTKRRVRIRPGDPRPITLTKLQHAALDRGNQVLTTIRTPFHPRANYFPHVIKSADQLKRVSSLREDVLDNLVRLRVVANKAGAIAFLDSYIRFIESGAREDLLIRYLIASGQAQNDLQAWEKLQRYRKTGVKRQGSLEYSREINLPFYDPDPARVLPSSAASQSIRLAQIRHFGQDNQVIRRAIKTIRDSGGDAGLVKRAVDLILGKVEEADTDAEKFFRTLRTIQGFKLGLASIANMTQGALNSLLAGDFASTVAGLRGLASKRGRRFGVESGAALESVLNESLRHAGAEGYALSKFLSAVGFTATERANRICAANAGAAYAARLLAKLKKHPTDSHARRRLAELLGIDPAAAIARGKLSAGEMLTAAKRFSDMTQFRSRPEDQPEIAATPAGKAWFQFKTYIYGQTRLIWKELGGEVRAGNYGRAARSTLVLATVFPMTGSAVLALRNLIMGRDDDEDESTLSAWFDGIAQSGALGVLGALAEASTWNRVGSTLAGPGFTQIGEAVEKVTKVATAEDREKALRNLGKWAFRQMPLSGLVQQRVFQ
jgi:hypothetical protein